MSTTAALSIAAATHVMKKIIDDLYDLTKTTGTKLLSRSRAEIKETPVARAVHAITKVKTLWNIEKEVSLYDFYYPTSIEFAEGLTKRVNGIKDFGRVGNFVVQGTAGQGKSIFLRYLCGQELDPRHTTSKLPIFVELRRIRSDLKLQDLILQTLERYKLPATRETWETIASSGKITLLLDAFDEIDPILSERTVSEIESLADIHRDKLQIIVTSRPDADIQRSTSFRVFKLAPLKDSDHQPFLKKICGDKDQADSLLKVLQASPSEVSGLLTTPLMMTLLVILYKSVQTVPDTVPKFYEELFDVLFYRHDHSKPGFRRKRFTTLDDSSVKRLFSAFCFFARLDNLGILTSAQFEACCERASESCDITVDPIALKRELVKTICLMQEDGFELSFIHKSVAQYYAASFVAKSSDEFIKQFYELAKGQRSWDLELRFLNQIDAYRYAKYFELPLMDQLGEAVGVHFGVPSLSDAEKLEQHFTNNTKLVLSQPRDINASTTKEKLSIVGWSTPDTFGDPVRQNAYFNWCWTLTTGLDSSGIKKPKNSKPDEKHVFIPATKFRSNNAHNFIAATESSLKQLREQHRKATAVVDTETKKTSLLTSLLKSSAQKKKK
jgi:hypothetical protein